MSDKNKTLIAVVLDRSGSMSVLRDEIIGGYNKFMDEQRKAKGECSVTLTQFDNEYEVIYNDKPLDSLPALDAATYIPRAMTALNDAIGRTINEIGAALLKKDEADRPGHVVMVIITDGMENSSKEFSGAKVRDMIKHQQDKYNWHFTYLASSLDESHVTAAAGLGIRSAAVMRTPHSRKGAHVMYGSSSKAVSRVRSGEDKKLGYTLGEQNEGKNADSDSE